MRAMDMGKHGFSKMQEVIARYCPSDFKIKVKECEDAHKTKEAKDHTKCLKCWSQEVEVEKMKPEKGGTNPDGTQRYNCPVCGELWWDESSIPEKCSCGTFIDREVQHE